MRPAGHGETQPRLDDDRLPIVLVVLDGLGDRPVPELGGRTPAEAAHTPNLDALARGGASGWHLPFGWGRAPTSELAHWAMFGFAGIPFPGRAVLEALGAGVPVALDTAVAHAALRTSRRDGDLLWITGRAGRADEADAAALLSELDPALARLEVRVQPLGGRGEALLTAPGHANADVTDSDPFFETFHPWLRPLPAGPHGAAFAETLTRVLQAARDQLVASAVNVARRERGLPALDALTTKWAGTRGRIPSFVEQVGVAGAAVTGTRLYRGLAAALGMSAIHVTPVDDLERDLAARVQAAEELIAGGARFVHVHTKATDEAGHSKQPFAKRDVLEAVDRGLAGLSGLASRAIVAVTGDHATPSTHGVMHAGEPTPLVVSGPTVRADEVTEFGEKPAHRGWYGHVHADELLPLLLGHANRPALLGHRITPRPVIALADQPEPLRVPTPPRSPGAGTGGERCRG
jgi:2,3-bisphosphoglycerate-independent phosphoglycerate mutase